MNRDNARTFFRNVLAVLSFAIYAAGVLSLHQERTTQFLVEQDGPFPVVISHWLYGAPFGLVDSGLRQFLTKDINSKISEATAEKLVERAFQGAAPETHELVFPATGTGMGGPVVVELAFLLFGPHARALPCLFVLLIGVSAACFLARYQDERLSALPIVLLALTLLLVTPLSGPPRHAYAQGPIGGIRYYAVIGILPALHWFFEFRHSGTGVQANGILRWMLLAVQIALLGFSIFVRSSPIYLLVPVMAAAGLALREQRARQWRPTLIRLIVPAAVMLIAIEALPTLAFPQYARVYQNVWHRVFVGLAVNPHWPFPGLREKYDCPMFGGHLRPGTGDDGPYCVWWDYGRKHGLSDAELNAKLYDPDYEAVLRDAFFEVLRAYPRQTLVAFLYYKPGLTLYIIGRMLRPEWASPPFVMALAGLQIALLICFIGARPPPDPLRDAGRRAGVLALFLVPSLIPQWIAWTMPWTAVDVLVYVLCGGIIAFWLVVACGFQLFATGTLVAARPDTAA